ncbi:hypothetical protein CFC21_004736 [Triticum aestivum]|uniref:PGG domain-containing protein n=3 Tax=Triticum aestivum TaxID=4565 RepID=A0A3B5YQA3_WHEAT|nr:hypothetical protein CFC21_004736 [Triticum aestivum]
MAYGADRSQLLARNVGGNTPLHCAARAGHIRMVRYLIDLAKTDEEGGERARAMVGIGNKRGETALHEAIRSGCMDMEWMVRELMSVDNQLARVDAFDGTSPLFLAISTGYYSLARSLYDNYDKALSYSGPEGQNALHAAAFHGFRHGKGMTKLLLEWNPNLVRQADDSISTPLHFAASAEDSTLELFLLVFPEWDFQSALSVMLPKEWVYRFYRWREHPTFLLVDACPNLSFQPDRNGLYPVHVAASAGSLVPIVILLRRSPDCGQLRDAQGRTFLHIAVEKKMLKIVQFVARRLKYKAIMNIQDYNGNTALHLAVVEGNWDIFRILVGNMHVRLNLTNESGATPMDIALCNAPLGFYFGRHARHRILMNLTLANAKRSFYRRDRFLDQYGPKLDEAEESQKITTFAQIGGIGSVLVATATFAATFTMPGDPSNTGPNTLANGKGGSPTFASLYAFRAFIISNTLAFICSTLATFSLVYTGVATVDIQNRIKLVAFSMELLKGAARSFCVTFGFAIYMVLPPEVARVSGTDMAACAMMILALVDAAWAILPIVTDTTILLSREDWGSMTKRLIKLGAGILANIVYVLWPYIVIFGLAAIKKISGSKV